MYIRNIVKIVMYIYIYDVQRYPCVCGWMYGCVLPISCPNRTQHVASGSQIWEQSLVPGHRGLIQGACLVNGEKAKPDVFVFCFQEFTEPWT